MLTTDIGTIKTALESNIELDSNIDWLIDNSLKNKLLEFSPRISSNKAKNLIEAGILIKANGKFRINDYSYFAYKLYRRHKDLLDKRLLSDLNALLSIPEQIEDTYSNDQIIKGLSGLKRTLKAISILDANLNTGTSFAEYIKSLNYDENKKEIYSFNEGYSNAMSFLNIDFISFCNNANQLISWINSDVQHNIPLGTLLGAIRNKVFADCEFGLNCFNYLLKNEDTEANLLIPVITGLYDSLGYDFYKMKVSKLEGNGTYEVSIICGLSNISEVSEIEANIFFQIYESVNKEEPETLYNLPRLIFAILRSNHIPEGSNAIEKSFVVLEELVSIDNENLIITILQHNRVLEKHIDSRKELVLSLINKSHFEIQKYLYPIGQIVRDLEDINFFEAVLCSIAQSFPFKPVSKHLSSPFHKFLSKYRSEFDKVMVSFLINDKASHRFLGLDIYSNLNRDPYRFDFDILKLDHLNQYKLWVVICQTYREPKNIFPCLFPLLKSNSPIVKESLICKLEEYSENYGASVTKVMEENLDLNIPELMDIYNRIDNYCNQFFEKYVFVKRDIRELDPFYTQNKLIEEFNKNHSRVFSNQLKKSTEENSIFHQICTTVTLLKGGGWKMDDRDRISKLGHFSSSFSLPRIYFTKPENFDYESNIESFSDWDENTFGELNKALDNE